MSSLLSCRCSSATRKAFSERSMPVTRAPRRAIASARMPPPQPTSSTAAPASSAWRAIHSRRSGLMSWSGRNSPAGSHQRWASELNFSSSAGSTFTELLKQKPRQSGVLNVEAKLSVPARANDLDLDAAVLRAALARLIVGDRLLLAFALGVDAVALNTFGHEVGLHRFGAPHRQALVVLVGADPVGVPNSDHHFEVDAAHLVRDVVELRLAFRLDHRLVEVEKHVRGERNLLGNRLGLLGLGFRLLRSRRGRRRRRLGFGRRRRLRRRWS